MYDRESLQKHQLDDLGGKETSANFETFPV